MPDKSATWELVRSRTGRDPEELLRELYLERRLSDREIAELVGVHRVTVTNWRQELGITRDERPAVSL
jgi:plasmid maintenance system antidote protein VapI